MAESTPIFYIADTGEQIEITPEELGVLIVNSLELTDDYTEEDATKDLRLLANMAGHVASGFIESSGVVQGKKVSGYFGKPPADDAE